MKRMTHLCAVQKDKIERGKEFRIGLKDQKSESQTEGRNSGRKPGYWIKRRRRI
jgi:hypothetical protein